MNAVWGTVGGRAKVNDTNLTLSAVFIFGFLPLATLYLFVPKVLIIFITPKNTPPKLRNSKMSLKVTFLGTPCIQYNVIVLE